MLTDRRGVAQSGSASGLGPEGRRFESYRPDQFISKLNPKTQLSIENQNPDLNSAVQKNIKIKNFEKNHVCDSAKVQTQA